MRGLGDVSNLLHLAGFQNSKPFSIALSIFIVAYFTSLLKLWEIIIYIIYIYIKLRNVSTILIQAISDLCVCLYDHFVSELQNFHLYQK